MFRLVSAALVAATLSVPVLATAQGAPRAPRGTDRAPMTAPRGGNVTAILNARRQLDLTPRQVAQLDSIERAVFAERQRVAQQMRPMADSARARVRREGIARDSASRAAARQQMEARRAQLQPLMQRMRQQDSTAAAAAERVLNDTQRSKWREMQAERRGFVRGARAGRGAQGIRDARTQRGIRSERGQRPTPSALRRDDRGGRPPMPAPRDRRPE